MKGPEELRAEMIEALVAGNEAALERAAFALAEQASEDFPSLHAALNLLGYHNRPALINAVMARAWPQVKETASYSTPAVNAYASRATDHLLYEYLQDREEPDASDPDLLARLHTYFAVDTERLVSYLSLLDGQVGRRWSLEDFSPLTMPNLNGLLVEFLGYLHRHENVAYSRAHLARELLPRYLLDRQAGNLYPREDVAELLRSGRRPRPHSWTPSHPLCPDAITLEKFLEVTLQTVHPQPYAASATFELLPAWFRFLQGRRLLDDEQRRQTEQELAPLTEWLQERLAAEPDPALHALQNWH